MERLKNILIEKDIRPSFQRIKILEFLVRNNNHPTVEFMYQNLTDVIPMISKATIYNTLNLFQEKGLVTAFNLSGEQTRYDYKGRTHAHFHCIACDRIMDMNANYPCFDAEKIGANQILEVQLIFKGICGDCRKKEWEKNSKIKPEKTAK